MCVWWSGWGKKCAAVLLGRTTHGLQEQYVEVAPHAAGRSWALGIRLRLVVQMCARGSHSREVFGYCQVDCMGEVCLRVDRRLCTRMQGECMASMCTWTESYRHRYNLEAH
jgi:hypothetical protein